MDNAQVSSGSSNADLTLLQYAQQQQLDAETSEDTGASSTNLKTSSQVYTDTVSQSNASGSGQSTTSVYTNYAGQPALTTPTPGAPDVTGAQLQNMLKSGTAFINSLAAGGAPTQGSLAQQFLDDCAQIPVTDPQILAYAQQHGESPGLVYKGIQIQESTLFEEQLAQLPPGLPPNAANMLRYAFANPQAAASLPAALQTLLKSMTAQVNAQIAISFGFSSPLQDVPPENAYLTSQVTGQYDDGFQTLLSQYAQSENLTDTQIAELTAMHYMGGLQTSDSVVNNVFNQINQQNTANMQASYGQGYVPQADSGHFTQVLNGAFRDAFQKALKNQQPALSSADQATIIALYANPNDPSISADDKARLTPKMQAITASSIAQVKANFGLEALGVQWTPVVTSIVNPNIAPSIITNANNAVTILNDIYNQAKNQVNNMPPGPMQESYKNFLKAIGTALAKFQEFLYSLQGNEAAVSNKLNAMSFDEQNSALQKQQDALKEQQQQHGKQVTMPPAMQFISDWTTTIIGDVFLGPVGIFLFVDKIQSQARGVPPIADKLFDGINDLCTKALGPAMGAKVAPFVNCTACVGVYGGSPTVCASMMTNDSQCVQGMVATCGGTPAQQQITSMAINMTVQIGFMIAMGLISGGANAAFVSEEMIGWAADLIVTGEKTADAMKAATATVKLYLSIISTTGKLAMSGYQLATAGLQAGQSITQGMKALAERISILAQADADSYSENVNALVAALKKVLTLIGQAMTSNGKEVSDVSGLMSQTISSNQVEFGA